MIDWTKPIQTRDGYPVRILCIDARTDRPVVGLVIFNANIKEDVYTWFTNGSYSVSKHSRDLINVPVKHEGWLNIYPTNGIEGYFYKTKEEADNAASIIMKRIACIKIEFTEGEGL